MCLEMEKIKNLPPDYEFLKGQGIVFYLLLAQYLTHNSYQQIHYWVNVSICKS